MKYLESEAFIGDNDSAEDAVKSSKLLQAKLQEKREALASLAADAPEERRLELELESAYILLDLDRQQEAWEIGKAMLDRALDQALWLRAVEACDILYQSEQADAIKALAHGIWLGVTFPIDPELSVAMLQHLIDETPDNSDGAAVAAVTACYVVDVRAHDAQREDLKFFTNQLLGQVARRHSQVEEQEIFDFWVERMELDDPGKFLPRLAKVLEVIVDGDWWFDRDALRAQIPTE
ncbi:MAG: hypothetical protein B6D72_09855 [gamma proteobacterium symbiont of Ctena orbiculata]|uniref:Uncharacterized protein n=1 Tax=Candidatus Thiodiazotropha taylori TaxID=2792791 RepID=A0A944M7D3_9GAMM|nr:hypothetical protein [Candidatus Thiodiazotropha taylori]PUB84446.1 MAG: hypothetical protein DBP00_14690 [gamma proteobacterium symbiont of Ctena orbiculata]MBT2988465.1 hypothetical protein [Candidatus Thiodiazotropha taylori]MBT2997371.1 hypothetical protein [Candidatus Thiodiazotropha taylori]MBT3000919.1 hypothetical protein [Candidatus Thiodiazotropha taylori]